MNDTQEDIYTWVKATHVDNVPENGGVCVKIDDRQIALFNFQSRGEWYACQNMCPHRMQMILSRGMLGDKQGIPKVACPFHKKTFSLCTGENLDGEEYSIQTYPVRIDGKIVYIGLA